jgi:hypothetical protein
MKTNLLPETDSIQALAEHWDTHDLTDFDDELEEVIEPVFMQMETMQVELSHKEANQVKKLARSQNISVIDLIHHWIAEKTQTA